MPSTERPATLITGASRGIGAAIARRLAATGHDLALTYRERRTEADAVAAEGRERGAEVVLIQADLDDLDRAAEIVPEATDRLTLHPVRDEQGCAVVYLLPDEASYTNGADIRITGG